ncbi:hypothetical protein BX616_002862 [Lobosporangium transversale]|nr:hypothetical protein BX616_002862 [Lobosporangium transversale]
MKRLQPNQVPSSTGAGAGNGNRVTIYRTLFDFYNDGWFVRNAWDSKKAQKGCVDYVIKAVLLTGGSNGRRRGSNTNAVICIGLGAFKTNRGQASKHVILTKKLVEKAKALGYPVVGCHEYYTSAKCPRLHCDTLLENVPYRSKYCRNCKAYFDRGVVGAENIARICESQIKDQIRPSKYKPPEGGVQGQASSGGGGSGGDDGTTKRMFSDDGEGGVEGSRPPKEPLLSPGEGETSSGQQQ